MQGPAKPVRADRIEHKPMTAGNRIQPIVLRVAGRTPRGVDGCSSGGTRSECNCSNKTQPSGDSRKEATASSGHIAQLGNDGVDLARSDISNTHWKGLQRCPAEDTT